MNIRTIRQCCVLVWTLLLTLILALPLKAVETPLATPPPSIYLDTESAVTVPLTGWNDLTRIFKVRFEIGEATSSSSSGEATSSSLQNGNVSTSIRSDGDVASPTNCCVQVALGTDANADGNLAPEETDLVLGYDCGDLLWRDERCLSSVPSASSPTQTRGTAANQGLSVDSTIRQFANSIISTATFTIPRQLFDRTWNAAKVTTRGIGRAVAPRTPSATITLILKNTPFVIRIR